MAPPAQTPRGLQAFNPEIGVLVDIVGAFTGSREDHEGNDKLSVREIELLFAQDIDPYTRFKGTFTLSDFEDVGVEEAFVAYAALPWGLSARLGRMRPNVGAASSVHRDQLDTVDEPFVVQRYLGLEGLYRTGLEVSRFLPQFTPALTQELTLGIMEGGVGEEGQLFGGTRRRPSYYAHLKNFWDVSPATSVELGTTYLLGSKDADARNEVSALGVDLSVDHKVSDTRRVKWLSELYYQDRAESFAISDDGFWYLDYDRHPWGAYSLVDLRLTPRWGVGARYDYVEPVDRVRFDPRNADEALSAYVTFYQSELARLRLQYQRAELVDGDDDDRLFLQGTYVIGVHRHDLK